MRFISLFSKYMSLIYRCISILAAILISIYTTANVILRNFTFTDYHLYINLFTLIFTIISIVFPVKIEFLAIVSFVYAVEILFTKILHQDVMGLLMYVLTCAILFSRGFFRKKRLFKTVCVVILFFVLFSTGLRFGTADFVKSLFYVAEYAFVITLIILFYYLYLRNQGKSPIEKFLDLSLFPELTDRDKEWIALILKETKYSTIASQYNVTEGTVKNRMRVIFKNSGR